MRFSRSAIFAVAALLGQSSLPAGSQPAEPTETWCRAHNFDPTAVRNCIEAEKRLLSKTAQKLPARPLSLPLPRPRPQAAPIVTAEPVQAFDNGVQE
jgi:hypothetical protein